MSTSSSDYHESCHMSQSQLELVVSQPLLFQGILPFAFTVKMSTFQSVNLFVLFSRHQLQQCHRSCDHLSTQQLPERLSQARQSSGMGERVSHQSFFPKLFDSFRKKKVS